MDDRELIGLSIGSLSAVGVAAALVGVRNDIANADVALVLVLTVFLSAAIGGRRAAVVTSLVAAVSFDFFHTQPYNSLKITAAADILTTVLLVVVGLAAAELAVRARQSRAARREEAQQIRRVHRVAELAARGESADDLALAISAELIEALHLRDCRFERRPFVQEFVRLDHNGTLVTTSHRLARDGFELPREGVEVTVSAMGTLVGRFVLVPTPGVAVPVERRLVAVALADQLAVAVSSPAA